MGQVNASPAALHGGDHGCAFTRNERDLAWLAKAFVRNAERAGARAIYFSEGPPDDVDRLGIPKPRRQDALVVLEAGPVLAPGRTFKTDVCVRALEGTVAGSREDGFAGAHVFVEVAWTLHGIGDPDARWEFENVAHDLDVFRRGDTLFLCQYDIDRFEAQDIERAAEAHPVIVAASSEAYTASAPARVRRDGSVFHVTGELDRGTAKLLVLACSGTVGTVTIDLAEATFFDVGAYRALETIARGCGHLRVRNVPPMIKRVLGVLQEDAGFPVEVVGQAASDRTGGRRQ